MCVCEREGVKTYTKQMNITIKYHPFKYQTIFATMKALPVLIMWEVQLNMVWEVQRLNMAWEVQRLNNAGHTEVT